MLQNADEVISVFQSMLKLLLLFSVPINLSTARLLASYNVNLFTTYLGRDLNTIKIDCIMVLHCAFVSYQ